MNHLQAFFQIKNSHLSNYDIFGIWESNLPRYYIPSVNMFPDIIHQCYANDEPISKAVMTPSQTILFYTIVESINEILHFHPAQPLAPLSMGFLLKKGSQLPIAEITWIVKLFMKLDCQSQGPPPYVHAWFTKIGKLILDMISFILGFKTNEFVDETNLVMLSMFTPGQHPTIKYDYASFIANKINKQFISLEREGVFKYTSVIYHLLLYYQPNSFLFPIRKLDSKGERRSVIFWTSISHNVCEFLYTYCEFIDWFIHLASTVLIGASPPRLSSDMRKILQLSKQHKIGDQYLYHNHTEIIIYGCELCPYKLTKYVPMRLFALQYFMQLINANLTHFYNVKKKAQLRIRNLLGPFIIKKREAREEADKIIGEDLKLKKSFWWVPYDPNSFISDRKVRNRLSVYIHHMIPEVEQFANQNGWVEGTLIEELTQQENME